MKKIITLIKYPYAEWKKFFLICMLWILLGMTGCSNETVQFLETELENEAEIQMSDEEIVQLTPYEVREQVEMDSVAQETEKEPVSIFVHVCGAVKTPGVYEMEAGSRVFQAVDKAGGVLAEAASEYINQAMEVTDGQQIYIPTQEETERLRTENSEKGFGFSDESDAQSGTDESSGKVNINTADKTELMTISGIGESRAQDIIAYREQHGGFSAIEEIMNVPGIKEAIFQKIKDGIEVK